MPMPRPGGTGIVELVDEPDEIADDELLGRLPTAYAVALRLYRRGADDREIAGALGTGQDAVGNILVLAERKLDELRRTQSDT